MEMDLKVSSAKWRPFCLGLNVLSEPQLQIEADSWDDLRSH